VPPCGRGQLVPSWSACLFKSQRYVLLPFAANHWPLSDSHWKGLFAVGCAVLGGGLAGRPGADLSIGGCGTQPHRWPGCRNCVVQYRVNNIVEVYYARKVPTLVTLL
jgi:hypothetical protein